MARLPWLRRLRWTAVAGQTLTVLGVVHLLHVPLPLGPVFAVIGFLALTNALLHGVPPSVGERPRFLAGVLGLDVVLLTILLRMTGGPHNPFAILYLVLVAVSSVALTPALTAWIAGASCAGYGFLFLAGDAPFRAGDPVCGVGPNLPLALHLRGMVVAYALTAGLVAWFAARLQQALRLRDAELSRAQEASLQHERFAALATLAAGAAHELGTPLGTIVVAAGELAREVREQQGRAEWGRDAELIRQEAFRCRGILDRLQNHAEDVPGAIEVGPLLDELSERFPTVRFEAEGTAGQLCLVAPPEALLQALANLISNALDASPTREGVRVRALGTPDEVRFEVADCGHGLSESTRAHAGEPFFTTKPPGRGMGLGLFLVRLLARRLSGDFRLEPAAGGGALAILSLPRHGDGGAR